MKEEKFNNLNLSDIKNHSLLSRREFLKRIGGGIIVFFTIGDVSILEAQRGRREYPTDFNAYLRIGADGRITCFTGKIEMGQGAITSLAQMAADELDAPLNSIDMVMGDTDICPWDMGTWGSMTTRFFGPALRNASAEARAVLLELASEQLKIPKERLITKDGVIFDKNQKGNSITYAQLAKGKTIERHLKEKVDLKTVSEFNVIGKDVLRRDALEKVTGKAEYAGDVRLPDMLYARILRPPAHDAKIKNIDISEVEKIKDVQLVREGDLIAVLHKNPDEAEKALNTIKVQFDVPEMNVDDRTIFEHLLNSAPNKNITEQGGDIKIGEKLAEISIEETYLNSYVAHSPIETHTALANIEGDKITVWVSSQSPFGIKDQIAQAIGFTSEKVRVITPFVGGGFGGKAPGRQAIESAQLAKITGKPVQVAWSRAEEFFYDTFRPAAVVKIRSGITKSGNIAFWDYGVYFAGERGSQLFYDVPHFITASFGNNSAQPFSTGAWRAPGNNTNTFARESQINIMASRAGIDPVEFRLKNLKDKRMIRVLKTAAEKFGWKPLKMPSGRGLGVACGIDSGTYVAHITEVGVDKKSGNVQIKRIVCAQDMGIVINPEGAKLQMDGCITMGLGYALTEEIHFRGREILDLNYDTYKIPRFSWVPKIETVLVDANEISPQGGGEPAIICMGGLIANAIYDATGAMLLQLPMTPERIREAIKRG